MKEERGEAWGLSPLLFYANTDHADGTDEMFFILLSLNSVYDG